MTKDVAETNTNTSRGRFFCLIFLPHLHLLLDFRSHAMNGPGTNLTFPSCASAMTTTAQVEEPTTTGTPTSDQSAHPANPKTNSNKIFENRARTGMLSKHGATNR